MEGTEQPGVDLTTAPTSATAASRAAATAIGGAAMVIMAGNLSSSVLGFVRGSIVAGVFGFKSAYDAFAAAQVVPQMFYDLTIGAAVSAALIPTFTEILQSNGKERLASTVGTVLALAWLTLLVVVVGLVALAHPVSALWLHFSSGSNISVAQLSSLIQIIVPSLFFLGTSAVLLSTLYAARRFTAAAFASCCYHLGIIIGAFTLARPFGAAALSIGAVAGSAAQVLVQVPSLARAIGVPRVRLRITPEVRKILRLYAPVAAGLIVSIGGQFIDIIFKLAQGSGAPSAMQSATTLTQFPIGIAVAALGFATLRALATNAIDGNLTEFKTTLVTGLRLVLFLTVPAALAYLALAHPICDLIYHNGNAGAAGVGKVATALDGYAIQIPFVGIDQLLIAAFYARGNTVTPMLMGIVGVCIYVVGAVVLTPHLHIFGLALANTIQNSVHGLVLLALMIGSIGTLRGFGFLRGVVRTLIAGLGMAALGLGASLVLAHVMPGSTGPIRLIHALIPLLLAAASYLLLALALRSEELSLIVHLVTDRMGRGQAAS